MRSQILVPLVALVVAAQACCCCTILGGPQPPYALTPSEDAAQGFAERMDAVDQDADGVFTISITEEEMTSLVAQMLAAQEEPPPISQVQVHFRNDRIEVYGTVMAADSISLPGMVAFSIGAATGGVAITVEEIALGPLPVPESVLQSLTQVINQALAENIQVNGSEAIITDVQIGAGQMTVSGKPKPD